MKRKKKNKKQEYPKSPKLWILFIHIINNSKTFNKYLDIPNFVVQIISYRDDIF